MRVADFVVESQECVDDAGPVAAVDCGTNSTRLIVVARRRRGARARDAHHAPGRGRGRHPAACRRRPSSARSSVLRASTAGCHGRPRASAGPGSWPRRPRGTPTTPGSSWPAVAAITGVRPEVLSGDEEGTAVLRRRHGTPAAGDGRRGTGARRRHRRRVDRARRRAGAAARRLAVDAVAIRSLDIGCVRVSERFLRGDPPRRGDLARGACLGEGAGRRRHGRTPAARTRTACSSAWPARCPRWPAWSLGLTRLRPGPRPPRRA